MRFLTLTMMILMCLSPVHARGLSIIRDTQIENILEQWSEPVLKSAGLDNDQVRMALVNSGDVNAFVAGGANIFIYAGLIQTAEYPEEVIGVIAHEIGHITGGHLIASKQAMKRSSYQSILSTVLGIGAAIVTGNGGAAGAISSGGSGLAINNYLSHSRIQESAADQAGLKYLKDTDINPKGLVSFLEKLEGQELLPASQQSEYMRTHPLTRDRVNTMREGVTALGIQKDLGQSPLQNDFEMVKAKLLAFREPHLVSRYYDQQSLNTVDQYAYGIMHYQQKHFDTALKMFDALIHGNPNDPYYVEMRAQIYRDAGQLNKAETDYRKALSLLGNDAPLIQISLGHILIENHKNLNEAETLLLNSLQSDNRDSRAYRLLATIKGRQKKEADAQYYLAEEAIASGRKQEAKRLVHLALQSKKLSPPLTVKANDLQIYLNRLPEG
jgi:predicted Zn-dependent protease